MEEPPIPEAKPPVDYSGYYVRPGDVSTYGSADKLEALMEGYYGMSWPFAVNVLLSIGARFYLEGQATEEAYNRALALYVIATVVIIALITFPFNKKIGVGLGWKPHGPALASFLIGLNSALFCGVIGYVIVQGMAMKEIKRYGIGAGFFGMRKKEVQERIAQMRAQPQPYQP